MANVFNENPMVLDTTWAAGSPPAGLTALSSASRFRQIWWNAAAVGDTITFADQNGNVLRQHTATVAGTNWLWDNPQVPLSWPLPNANGKGWALTTMSSGKVYLLK